MENSSISEAFACSLDRWQPAIGDPGVVGWLIVALYAVTAIFALSMLTKANLRNSIDKLERIFWLILALMLIALAINKQLDLQSFFTAFGRCLSRLQGWYENRRDFQVSFILAVLSLMPITMFVLWFTLRQSIRKNWLCFLGIVFIFGFVAIRAAGFHYFDILINFSVANIRANWALEIIGPTMIIVNCVINHRTLPASIPQTESE